MASTLLNEQQRLRLRMLAKKPVTLAAYVQELHDTYPECFHHTKETMVQRVFMDEPLRPIHHARFVRSAAQSPRRIVPVTT